MVIEIYSFINDSPFRCGGGGVVEPCIQYVLYSINVMLSASCLLFHFLPEQCDSIILSKPEWSSWCCTDLAGSRCWCEHSNTCLWCDVLICTCMSTKVPFHFRIKVRVHYGQQFLVGILMWWRHLLRQELTSIKLIRLVKQ